MQVLPIGHDLFNPLSNRREGKIVLLVQTKVFTNGRVALPVPVRRSLGIRAGDPFDIHVKHGTVVSGC
jgi:AbrB family looped-hinge helix DNA binding protein